MRAYLRSTRIPGDAFDTLYIRKVFVPPARRGQGIARKMLNRFLEKHTGCYILLEAYPFDSGGPGAEGLVKFYKSLGFKRLYGSTLNLMIREPR